MKAIILQDNLHKGLASVARIVAGKPQLPVLSNVLIAAKKNGLVLTTTNLEIGMVIPLAAKVSEEGEVSVPAKPLLEVIAGLPPGEITVTEKDLHLTVAHPSSTTNLAGIAATEFPALPNFNVAESFSFQSAEFIGALRRTTFASALDESRPVLTGVRFDFQNGGLDMAATDGFRLSTVSLAKGITTAKKGESQTGFIVPTRSLLEVMRLIEEENVDEVAVTSDGAHQLRFAVGKAEIVTRLINGDYPDYRRILPKEATSRFVADKEEVSRAVKLASIFARESANVVKLSFSGGEMKISASSNQLGTNEGVVQGKYEGADDLVVAFNYRYLLDFLGSVEGDEVAMGFSGPLAPGSFTDPKVPEYLHVVMPVRLQS
jgi:DNA polymerase-3 subunit beta